MIRLLCGTACALVLSACISDEKLGPLMTATSNTSVPAGNLLKNSELSDGDCQGWEINGNKTKTADPTAPSPPNVCHVCWTMTDGDQITIIQRVDATTLTDGATYQAQGFVRVTDNLALHDLQFGLALVDEAGNSVDGTPDKPVLPSGTAWTSATASLKYDATKKGKAVVVGFNDVKTGVGTRCYDVDNISLVKQ